MGLLDDAIREHLELKRRRGADPAEVARAEQEALGPVRREPEAAPLQEAVQEPAAHEHHEDDARAYAEPPQASAPADAPPAREEQAAPPIRRDEPAPGHDHDASYAGDTSDDQTRILRPADSEPAAESAPPAPPAPAPVPAPERPFADEPPPHVDPAPRAEPDVHPQDEADSALPPHGDVAHDEPVDPRHSDIVHQPTTEWRMDDEEEPFAPEPPAGEQAQSDEDVLEETPDFLQETPEHDRLWFEQRPPRDFDFDD